MRREARRAASSKAVTKPPIEKNDDGFAVGATPVEIDEITVRVGQFEIWEPLANFRTG